MTFIVVDELSNDMVFLLTVEASNVEADHCQFLEFFHFIIFSSRPIVLSVTLVVVSSRRGVRFLVYPSVLLRCGVRLLLSIMLLLVRGIDSLHFRVSVISCTRAVGATVIFLSRLVMSSCSILFRPSFLLLVEQVSLYDFLLLLW